MIKRRNLVLVPYRVDTLKRVYSIGSFCVKLIRDERDRRVLVKGLLQRKRLAYYLKKLMLGRLV